MKHWCADIAGQTDFRFAICHDFKNWKGIVHMNDIAKTVAAASLAMFILAPTMSAFAATPSVIATASQDMYAAQQYMVSTQMKSSHDWTVIDGFAANRIVNNSTWSSAELAANLKTTNDYARFTLALLAAHLDPHNYNGKNDVKVIANAQIKAGVDAGKFADNIDGTGADSITGQAFSIFALVDAGGVTFDKTAAANWLMAQQNQDGGFGYSVAAGASDPDDTAFVMEALSLLGTPSNAPVMTRAIAYLQKNVAPDGGILGYNKVANSDSSAVVIDALTQLGIDATTWTAPSGGTGNLVTSLLSDYDVKSGGFMYDTSGTQYAGVNGYSTKDAIVGLSAVVTGRSLYSRLQYTALTYVDAYWQRIEAKGGAWTNGHWQTFAALKPLAVAGSAMGHLNPYWQNVATKHGLWTIVNGKSTWVMWDANMARQALAATYGLDSVDVSGL